MKKQIDQVAEFHDAFGVPNLKESKLPSDERIALRLSLIQEEFEELIAGLDKKDMTDVADALTDIQYVLFGTVLEFGLQDKFEALFEEVHRSNMSKLDENGKAIHRADGKVLKSDRYFRPNLKKILND